VVAVVVDAALKFPTLAPILWRNSRMTKCRVVFTIVLADGADTGREALTKVGDISVLLLVVLGGKAGANVLLRGTVVGDGGGTRVELLGDTIEEGLDVCGARDGMDNGGDVRRDIGEFVFVEDVFVGAGGAAVWIDDDDDGPLPP
jgi:hypothetical protein